MAVAQGKPYGATVSRVAVIIATYNRPDHLRTCLEHLDRQTLTPTRVIVVDASPGEESAEVVRTHPSVVYLRNPLGRGHTATSRQLGVAVAQDVDVLAFLDDDAFADEDWLEELVKPYEDPLVAGVGGRASNGIAGEENVGHDAIGKFRSDSTLTGNFAAVVSGPVDIDHMLGANMSFRASAVSAAGGIADFYPGTCIREESELALRLCMSGYRLVYAPRAHALHVAGTYARGRRFDLRYVYYSQRNHFVLLGRLFGPHDYRYTRYASTARRTVQSHLRYATRAVSRRRLVGDESILSGFSRGLLNAASASLGMCVGHWLVASGRIPVATPVRRPDVAPAVESVDSATHVTREADIDDRRR